jgi:hypothetical protein
MVRGQVQRRRLRGRRDQRAVRDRRRRRRRRRGLRVLRLGHRPGDDARRDDPRRDRRRGVRLGADRGAVEQPDPQRPGGQRAVRRRRQRRDLRVERRRRVPDRRDHDRPAAPRRIGAATTANWFSGSALGWQLAAADHDGDGTDDLITTAVFGAAGAAGAALVFYGGTVPTGTVRISDTSGGGQRHRGHADVRGDLTASTCSATTCTTSGRPPALADATDDLAVAYAEDGLAQRRPWWCYRSTGGRPAAPGVTREPFTVGRDVKRALQHQRTTCRSSGARRSARSPISNGDGARELVFGDYRFALRRRHRAWWSTATPLGTAGVAHHRTPFGTVAPSRTFAGANRGQRPPRHGRS